MDRISGCFAEIQHHSSSVGRNVLHLSFKTKYCHNIFNFPEVQKRCEEIFQEVCIKRRWIIREIGFDQDHVHITIDAGTDRQKDVAKALKGTTGRKLLNEFPGIKKPTFGEADSGARPSFSTASVKEPSPIWMRTPETKDYHETSHQNQGNSISMISHPRLTIIDS